MRAILPAGALLVFVSVPTFAARITVDPNAGPAPGSGALSAPKEISLDERITYEGGYKRLSAVCQEIRKMTGIRVGCGQNANDWRVRDVPVVVSARDIPAGVLLRAVAECAHAQFLRVRVAGEEEKDYTYTVSRTKKVWDEIAAPENARRQAARECAKWAWDALTACAKLPESPMPALVEPYAWDHARLAGSLLASLGTAARDRILDGEILRLPVDSGTAAKLYDAIWDKWQSANRNSTAPKPDARRAYIKLSYSEYGSDVPRLKLRVSGFPMVERSRGGISYWVGIPPTSTERAGSRMSTNWPNTSWTRRSRAFPRLLLAL